MTDTERKRPPFRADHVGSLKRPESLQRARERLLGAHTAHENLGSHANDELRAIEDEAIRETIRLQEDCGLCSITDGEFRRRSWWTDVMLGFDGIEESNRESPVKFKDKQGKVRANSSIELTERIAWRGSPLERAFTFLRDHTRQTPKLTVPAPSNLHYFLGGVLHRRVSAYQDRALFWDDFARAYRKEVETLYAAGCRYIQFDDVTLAFLCDSERREEVRAWGLDPADLLGEYLDALNAVIEDRPDDLVASLHICRGNFSGAFGATGGYDAIADQLLNQLAVDAFFLEYDSPRAGTFEPLRFLPANKVAVLGLVTTKDPQLEDVGVLKRRIDEAARSAPLEQLALSPQCGFSSNYLGNPVTIDDQRRKLELVVSVAGQVWS